MALPRKQETWREFLAFLLRDEEERDRIAKVLQVQSHVLASWVNRMANPSSEEMQTLLKSITHPYQERFRILVEQEVQHSAFEKERLLGDIPSSFYALISHILRETPDRFWSISTFVLQQAIVQLDAAPLSLELAIFGCMSPRSDGRVQSLRHLVSMGTELIPRMRYELAGRESLAGASLMSLLYRRVTDSHVPGELRYVQDHRAFCTVTFPLLREQEIVGCLVATNTRRTLFTPRKIALLSGYADVVAQYAFRESESVHPAQIELGVLPDLEVQRMIFERFRERIAALRTERKREASALPQLEESETITQMVLRQIEEELLNWGN